MVKEDLIKAVAAKSQLDEYSARLAVDATIEAIKEELQGGGSIILRNFGVFAVKERSPKSVRNIYTGVQYTLGARKRVVFTPGKELKLN